MVVLIAIALLVVSGVAYQRIGLARDRRQFAAPGMLVDVGGRRLHVRCTGAGTPAVIFEAGIAASSVSWSRVQPQVAEFTRACSYDRAGLAWSDPGERDRCTDTFVAELTRLLDAGGIAPPYVLVGHSFGGFIIRAFARAHPEAVAGLVFVDTLHPEEWMDLTPEQRRLLRGGVFLSRVGGVLASVGIVRLSLSLLTGGAPGVPRRFSRMFGSRAAALLEHIVGEVQKLPADVLPSIQAHWSNPRAFHGMAQHLAALPACSVELKHTPDVGNVPVVVLSAADRQARWLEADAALARSSRAGRHTVSTKAGHWIQLDDPALIIEAVRDVVSYSRSSREYL
jgi:pimeloyl-ACP methyl ester carboxylesterase